ncbi:ADP-ribosylglycohydrolase family protein [Congregibacter variabilis]|uniref:ADP-ribosylglycohydrolase family protein n=1 Tax=Congregibacter variabilis TaxID=3081200 RepID=A0ABZ0I5S7_9GAMM|nr:ADP-ribosylglycohydrolase family protein [Congregibacter sp. IMCC43200]
MRRKASAIALIAVAMACLAPSAWAQTEDRGTLNLSRSDYARRMEGFWLGQSIANWTGLVTEMDKIGGEGIHGTFYTRHDWGKADQPSIWSEGVPSDLSPTIDWVFADEDGIWGADDDTDIEYMYQHLLLEYQTSVLSPEQIRDGWLRYIYSDDNTPFTNERCEPENYLWVSNQQAHDLMREQGLLPPATSDPALNPHHDMIDAQLTTEIFGLFAPGRPDVALRLAHLPIRTTARGEAALAAEFYIVMHSLAATADPAKTLSEQLKKLRQQARRHLPDQSYTAKMYDFVATSYEAGLSWEDTRDAFYQRYQVEQADGYDVSSRELFCNGCFASGINFGASIISLFYGNGDYQETVKIAVLAGWDSDNPAATWGGLLGFLLGRDGIEDTFGRTFSTKFNIHRTRGGFPNNGLDDFPDMAQRGLRVVDRVIVEEMDGVIDAENKNWQIPLLPTAH